MRRDLLQMKVGSVWWKVGGMLGILFFIFLADAILSDWVPAYMETQLGSPLLMGLIMSSSSVVGLLMDLIIPQWLKGTSVRKLTLWAILASLGFSATLLLGTVWPMVGVFLLGMAVWGVYYEFLGFATSQFVAEGVEVEQRSAVWGVVGIFKSLAYMIGPLMGTAIVVAKGDRALLFVTFGLTLFGLGMLLLGKTSDSKVKTEVEEISLLKELGHWRVLIKRVWPIILLSLGMGLLDSVYWTTGTVWTDKLAKIDPAGGLFLSLYMLPTLFVGWVMVRLRIFEHKKKLAQELAILGGIVLSLINLSSLVWWQLAVVFVSSSLMAAVYPLLDAVYTDVVVRMGRERKHLMGLSSAAISMAYIIGPIMAGGLSQMVGEQRSFSIVGGGLAILGGALLLLTPKKIKLPQEEIRQWS